MSRNEKNEEVKSKALASYFIILYDKYKLNKRGYLPIIKLNKKLKLWN